MRPNHFRAVAFLAAALGITFAPAPGALAAALTSAITYQGQIKQDGVPANDVLMMDFKLFDGPVSPPAVQVGATISQMVNVVNGLFTVELNGAGEFGATAFNGNERWLEVTVDAKTLTPRQKVTAAPAALSLRFPFNQSFDTGGNVMSITSLGTGRVLAAIHSGAGGLAAIRADSTGDSALFGQGSTATAEGVTGISTGGANAVVGQAQGATGQAGDFMNTNALNPDAALFAATAGTGPAVHAEGLLQIGSSMGVDGEVKLFDDGSSEEVVRAYVNTHGGNLDIKTETGDFVAAIEADAAGEGGFLAVYRNTSSQGFTVDGNTGGNEPRVTINGSARDAVFDMALSGDASVALPNSAISAAECSNEPGVASNKEGTSGVTISTTALATISSRTITVPAAGHVLVLATAQVQIPHVTGTNDLYNFGVSDSATALPDNQDLFTTVISALPSGNYQKVVTPHGLFTVSAGANTFFFLGEKTASTAANAEAFDVQLTLVYFPTSYGTVVSTLSALAGGDGTNADALRAGADQTSELTATTRGGQTAEEIAAERAQSIADNQARLDREMAEMQQQLADLKKELADVHAAQRAAATVTRSARPTIKPVTEGAEK